ncbi:hypothetical protein R3P38DRAFT_2775573 [Favolaschia claudopus]|uniref:Uncharacterized protein n=1 Tax=Favolaschia claudopus TaxID=2862362 RepID=A0AAW0BSS8_9AGAR
MTAAQPNSSAVPQTELQELISLVSRLSAASTEAMRLAVEVQARLPVVVAVEVSAARAAATSAAAAQAAAAQAAAAQAAAAQAAAAQAATAQAAAPPPQPDLDDDDQGPLFVRGIPLTPAEVEEAHPPGQGEICETADAQCNGVPFQLKAKKTSRVSALDYYREHYNGPSGEGGVQKWVES